MSDGQAARIFTFRHTSHERLSVDSELIVPYRRELRTTSAVMASIREKASDMTASAKADIEKTKASAQEKVERMRAHNPAEKEMATERKEEKKMEADLDEQEAHDRNAATRVVDETENRGGYSINTTGYGSGAGI